MRSHAPRPPLASEDPVADLTPREVELLEVTMRQLREGGYDRLTIDQVAAEAHASKATLYRRWPSKVALVMAAFSYSTRQVVVVPDTGSLRGDLLQLGGAMARQLQAIGDVVAGLLPEFRRTPQLRAVMEDNYLKERRSQVEEVLQRAVDRQEIRAENISGELWDLLPGYLLFRTITPGPPPTGQTIHALVDDVLLPSLTRTSPRP